jgi:flagella basal body P-ring formation protein FlgA
VLTSKPLLAAVACLALAAAAGAAEIRLKQQARTSASVVTLGDVAEVFAADAFQAEQLRGIELGPAPAPGRRRYIRVREVQDAVWTRGISLAMHQFSGVEQTEVTGPADVAEVEAAPAFQAEPAQRERAEKTVANLILAHLRKQTNPREPFQVALSLTDAQIETVLTYGTRLVVQGGAAPWVGAQQFTLGLTDGKRQIGFTVDALSTLPPGVVVVIKPLSAGSIIHPADVELRSPAGVNPNMQPFRRIEEVVGQETTWSIPAGSVLTPQSVRRPIVVRRGRPITVYARSAGLRVRTTARAREDGGLGDLITVEPLDSRDAFFAKVTGVQEAEVFAAPATAAPLSTAAPAAASYPNATYPNAAYATPAYPSSAQQNPAAHAYPSAYQGGYPSNAAGTTNRVAAAPAYAAPTYPNAMPQMPAALPAAAYQGGR